MRYEQDILHAFAIVMYMLSAFQLRKGFVNSTSWFCLFFVLGFTGNIFGYVAAWTNNPNFSWMKGLDATALHQEILIVSMLTAWISHLLVRRTFASYQVFARLPVLPIPDFQLDKVFRFIAIAGAGLVVFLSLNGYLGYFIREEYLENPPSWLDSAKSIASLSSGLQFLVIARDFQKYGATRMGTNCIILLWVVAGLFTGFKSFVVLPAFFIVVSAWMAEKLRIRYFFLLGFLLILAYSVIEPLREAKIRRGGLTAREGLVEVLGDEQFKMMELSFVVESFLLRMDLSTTGIQVLEAHEQRRLKTYEKRLGDYFRYFPLMAFIPRALWPEKPLANLGAILYQDLTGNTRNSITPSICVTSFIWGGWPGLVVIYAVWGACCTLGGQIVIGTKHLFYRYSPFILMGGTLSIGSDIMASSYISILRLSVILFVLNYSGFLRPFNTARENLNAS